ncbi:pyridoxamine 5'-phosphate oxidase family protein [Candidatus Uabimicrobium sp. HlEnr_7]|uniref:pyridoxamine 5'-phosphate oxidase family protein n=1 Tax=Candidatus Uabimicrobium helgolandensis TaxID=3095367 RepID=UPI003556B823
MQKTQRTTIKRVPQRANYDLPTIHKIIDEAYVCSLGFQNEDSVHVIPTVHWRIGNTLYIHGATKSRLIHCAISQSVCINITLLDGLVLARSAFHHSMNYRSLNIYGRGFQVVDAEKEDVLTTFVEKITPERIGEIRMMNKQELKATTVVGFNIEEAVAKIRTGPPVDDKEDYALPVWAGVIPLRLQQGEPVEDK